MNTKATTHIQVRYLLTGNMNPSKYRADPILHMRNLECFRVNKDSHKMSALCVTDHFSCTIMEMLLIVMHS